MNVNVFVVFVKVAVQLEGVCITDVFNSKMALLNLLLLCINGQHVSIDKCFAVDVFVTQNRLNSGTSENQEETLHKS